MCINIHVYVDKSKFELWELNEIPEVFKITKTFKCDNQ